MTEWHYRTAKGEQGPLSNAQLREKVASGVISPETEIRKDDSQWVLARAVSGLFEAAQAATTEQVCPYCGERVTNAPAKCNGCGRIVNVALRTNTDKPVAAKKTGFEELTEMFTPVAEDDTQTKLQNTAVVVFATATLFALLSLVILVIRGGWLGFLGVFLAVFAVVSAASGIYLLRCSRSQNPQNE